MKYFCDSASNSKDSGALGFYRVQFSTRTVVHGHTGYRVLSSTRSPGRKLECTSVAQKLVALRMASKSSPTPGSSSPYAVPQLQLTPQSPFPALEPTNPAPTLSRQEQQRQEQNYAAAYISARAAHQFSSNAFIAQAHAVEPSSIPANAIPHCILASSGGRDIGKPRFEPGFKSGIPTWVKTQVFMWVHFW